MPVERDNAEGAFSRSTSLIHCINNCQLFRFLTTVETFDGSYPDAVLSCGPVSVWLPSCLRRAVTGHLVMEEGSMTKEERTQRGETYRVKLSDHIRATSVSTARTGVGLTPEDTVQDAVRRTATATLSYLLMREDGWLRLVPAADGKTLYIKWKFSRGKWSGRYVMAVVEVWQWDYGLTLLADKLEAVDLSIKIPTKDTPYGDYGDDLRELD